MLLNSYHENISFLHVNMMPRRSYYVPFESVNEALKDLGYKYTCRFNKMKPKFVKL